MKQKIGLTNFEKCTDLFDSKAKHITKQFQSKK